MNNEFFSITVDRERLVDLLDIIGETKSGLVEIGIESSNIDGERVLWVSNTESGNARIVVK